MGISLWRTWSAYKVVLTLKTSTKDPLGKLKKWKMFWKTIYFPLVGSTKVAREQGKERIKMKFWKRVWKKALNRAITHRRAWTLAHVEMVHGTLAGNYAFTAALHEEAITTESHGKDLHPLFNQWGDVFSSLTVCWIIQWILQKKTVIRCACIRNHRWFVFQGLMENRSESAHGHPPNTSCPALGLPLTLTY